MRKRNHNKFAKKKHSKRGMLAAIFAAASIFTLCYLTGVSFLQDGNGGTYLGSVGVLALFAAFFAFVQSVRSLREEDTFRGIPIISAVISVLAAGAWTALYVIGFL